MRYLLPSLALVLAAAGAAPAQYPPQYPPQYPANGYQSHAVAGYGYYPPYYPAQKVIAQGVAVAPLVVSVPIVSQGVPVEQYGQPYYYSATQAYQEKAYLRDVIREELRALSAGPPPAPAPKPAGPAPVPPSARPPQADETTPPELQAKVLAAFHGKAGCINCHGPTADKGGLRLALTDQQGQPHLLKLPDGLRWKVYGLSTSGLMPPAAANDSTKAMEAAHFPALLEWAAGNGKN